MDYFVIDAEKLVGITDPNMTIAYNTVPKGPHLKEHTFGRNGKIIRYRLSIHDGEKKALRFQVQVGKDPKNIAVVSIPIKWFYVNTTVHECFPMETTFCAPNPIFLMLKIQRTNVRVNPIIMPLYKMTVMPAWKYPEQCNDSTKGMTRSSSHENVGMHRHKEFHLMDLFKREKQQGYVLLSA